jgi:hypothetical protein
MYFLIACRLNGLSAALLKVGYLVTLPAIISMQNGTTMAAHAV